MYKRQIQRRIRDHIERLDVLIPEEFGFRELHSSIHQLMRPVECITEAGCQGKQTTAIFLDVEKSFDRVWQEGDVYKRQGTEYPLGVNVALNLIGAPR